MRNIFLYIWCIAKNLIFYLPYHLIVPLLAICEGIDEAEEKIRYRKEKYETQDLIQTV